jgi:anti-sigma factor RsiW
MREKSPQELISAYFDGELTPAEVLAAEQLLEHDAAARRLLAEFEGVRSCLSDLPRQRLPRDLSQSVLREAERQMLQAPAAASDSRPSPSTASAVPAPWVRIGLAFVVAASLLLAFVLPGRFGNAPAERTPVAVRGDSSTPPPPRAPATGDHFGDNRRTDFDLDGAAAAENLRAGKTADELSADGTGARGFSEKLAKERGQTEYFSKAPEATVPNGAVPQGAVPNGAGPMSPAASGSMPGGIELTQQRPPQLAEQLYDQQGLAVQQQLAGTTGQAASEPTNSYVLDVTSDVVQNRVLARFEEVLSEQQISLEDNGAIAEPSADQAAVATEAEGIEPQRKMPSARSDRQQRPNPSNADHVYVIDATPEQLSNTIVGLNRLAIESETPVRFRRLGTNDYNAGVQTLNSNAGDMPGSYGINGTPLNAASGAGPAPASAATGQAADKAAQLAGGRGGAALSSGKPVELAIPAETAKKSAENETAEIRQQRAPLPRRELNEQKPLSGNFADAERASGAKDSLPAVQSNKAAAADEAQQRVIFIFRVVPPTAPVASPMPTAEPAKP